MKEHIFVLKRAAVLTAIFTAFLLIVQSAQTAWGAERSYYKTSVARDKLNNGRLLVPLRLVSEYTGGLVEWHASEKRITITKGDRDIRLSPGSGQALVNGTVHLLDAPALLEKGVTYVPLRFVGEALGLEVNWSSHSQTAILTDRDRGVTLNVEVEPPLPLKDALTLMNQVVAGRDLSGVKQKQQLLRPYFTQQAMEQLIFSGGIDLFLKTPELKGFSFSGAHTAYTYGNDNMMFFSRNAFSPKLSITVNESATLIRTSQGWKIGYISYAFDYPH